MEVGQDVGSTNGYGTKTRLRASPLRVSTYVDRVAVVGIALSVLASIVLDLTGAADGVESFLACLVGIAISLILDASGRAERRFQLRVLIQSSPWLGREIVPVMESAASIERRYADTPIANEARIRCRQLREGLAELSNGRILRAQHDYENLIEQTQACRYKLQAVTDVTPDTKRGLGWWTSDIGKCYWQAHLEALDRGVEITRIFPYTEITPALSELVEIQRRAGVRVGLVAAESLDPELRLALVLWDDAGAWEPILNQGGEIIGNRFTMNNMDLYRISRAFQRCAMVAGLNGV